MPTGAAIVYAVAPVTMTGTVHRNDESGVSITAKMGQRDVRRSYSASSVIAASDLGPGGFVTVMQNIPISGHYGGIEETDSGVTIHTEGGREAHFSGSAEGTRLEIIYDREGDRGPIATDAKWARKLSSKWQTASARAEERASSSKRKSRGKVTDKSKGKKSKGKPSKKVKGKGKKKVLGRKL